MKIELLNREHWLPEIDKKLQWIEQHRAKEDRKFIAIWRKRRWLPDRQGLPEHGEDFLNYKGGYMQYPCSDYWKTQYTIKELRDAMLTSDTGAIYVDADELRMLRMPKEEL